MTTYRTLTDVIKAKTAEADKQAIRWAKADAKAAAFKVRTDLHPAIGALMSAKGVRYYAYIGGVYKEGTPEHLTALLAA